MPDIRHQLQIGAAPAAIFPLVASASGFAQWWAADSRDVIGGGPTVELGFFNRTTVYRLRPQTLVTLSHSAWYCESGQEWKGTLLEFLLAREPNGTLLRFIHSGWQEETDYFVSCNTVWGELLFRLKSAAEGHPRGPLFLADSLAD